MRTNLIKAACTATNTGVATNATGEKFGGILFMNFSYDLIRREKKHVIPSHPDEARQ
ncbi:MAG: hypothetical protein ONB44_09690 [candidate division KSB1 bacterium]|nr:hypothetical protein [candidate division KSB1 bacterium]MDZ7302400.1 hypothetical protein [candidate division KSB1 bacterium]MDZ7311603.1 hypothetical protein [candidate division KSB1 bacterium]